MTFHASQNQPFPSRISRPLQFVEAYRKLGSDCGLSPGAACGRRFFGPCRPGWPSPGSRVRERYFVPRGRDETQALAAKPFCPCQKDVRKWRAASVAAQVIQQWGSIMQALLTMLYRFYLVTRLLEIRRRRIAF
jgi:hypothetical protein